VGNVWPESASTHSPPISIFFGPPESEAGIVGVPVIIVTFREIVPRAFP